MLLRLCPLIRLLQVCTRMLNDNNLDQIERILMCPLLFYPPSLLAEFVVLENKEPPTLCLFYAVNWYGDSFFWFTFLYHLFPFFQITNSPFRCRELINAFA